MGTSSFYFLTGDIPVAVISKTGDSSVGVRDGGQVAFLVIGVTALSSLGIPYILLVCSVGIGYRGDCPITVIGGGDNLNFYLTLNSIRFNISSFFISFGASTVASTVYLAPISIYIV